MEPAETALDRKFELPLIADLEHIRSEPPWSDSFSEKLPRPLCARISRGTQDQGLCTSLAALFGVAPPPYRSKEAAGDRSQGYTFAPREAMPPRHT